MDYRLNLTYGTACSRGGGGNPEKTLVESAFAIYDRLRLGSVRAGLCPQENACRACLRYLRYVVSPIRRIFDTSYLRYVVSSIRYGREFQIFSCGHSPALTLPSHNNRGEDQQFSTNVSVFARGLCPAAALPKLVWFNRPLYQDKRRLSCSAKRKKCL
jgi:hypothetical protein